MLSHGGWHVGVGGGVGPGRGGGNKIYVKAGAKRSL